MLTFNVGVAAVFAVENKTPIIAPAVSSKPAQVTTLAAVPVAVDDVPYQVVP